MLMVSTEHARIPLLYQPEHSTRRDGMNRLSSPLQMHRFPSESGLNGLGTLRYNTNRFSWSMFVTGRAPGDEFSFGYSSVWEYIRLFGFAGGVMVGV